MTIIMKAQEIIIHQMTNDIQVSSIKDTKFHIMATADYVLYHALSKRIVSEQLDQTINGRQLTKPYWSINNKMGQRNACPIFCRRLVYYTL